MSSTVSDEAGADLGVEVSLIVSGALGQSIDIVLDLGEVGIVHDERHQIGLSQVQRLLGNVLLGELKLELEGRELLKLGCLSGADHRHANDGEEHFGAHD